MNEKDFLRAKNEVDEKTMSETLDEQAFMKIKNAFDEAENDTRPIVGVRDGEVFARGDVNNIKIEPRDYVAQFAVPENMVPNMDEAKDLGTGFYLIDIEYKDVLPTVMDNMKYTSAIMQLEPFYKKLEEDGSISNLDDAEILKQIFFNMSDEIVEALYRMVRVMLNVDDELIKWMTPGSVLKIGIDLLSNFPSVVNQSDLF